MGTKYYKYEWNPSACGAGRTKKWDSHPIAAWLPGNLVCLNTTHKRDWY
jgi:hypothetical protein